MTLLDMAHRWYGYGQWHAPYWFIGPEPGMAVDEGDNLARRYDAWQKLGGTELIDCIAHHRAFGHEKWHSGKRPPTQPTWRQLIRLLFSFKGYDPSVDMIREYQRTQWGTLAGETCVMELSSLAAHDLAVERDRRRFRDERISFLRRKILEYQPTFIVMYGTTHLADWEQLAGGPFDDDRMRSIGRALGLVTPHPRRCPRNQDWESFGTRLRARCGNTVSCVVR